jgi:hypothetical protein
MVERDVDEEEDEKSKYSTGKELSVYAFDTHMNTYDK